MELLKQDLIRVVTRLPKDVRNLIKTHGLYLAGGFIREQVAGNDPKDIDLLAADTATLYVAGNDLESVRLREGEKTRQLKTDNAVTVITPGRISVQLIHRWLFSSPEECAASFDFTVCQAVVWWEDDAWHSYVVPEFYPDLASRRLRYTFPNRNEDAGGSILRVRKFLHRGYHIDADALADVIARLAGAVDWTRSKVQTDEGAAQVIRGLLREVDPLLVVDGIFPEDEGDIIASEFTQKPPVEE